MSLVYVDDDPWLKEYDNCESLCLDLTKRVESFRNVGGGESDATDIKLRLTQCDQQLSQLRTVLMSDDPDRFITSAERERRDKCLQVLYEKARSLRIQFSGLKPIRPPPYDPNRELLFEGVSGNNNATQKVPEDTTQLDPEAIRKRQAQVIEEQDRGLENLSKIISRQKHIAQNIDSEVINQTEIITNLTESVSRVGERTEGTTRRTAALITRDNACGYWVVAVLLFIAIIIVGVL